MLPIAAGTVLVLWAWTLLASDAPATIVTVFWLVVGGGLAWWVRREMRPDSAALQMSAERLESALRRDAADVYDIRARAFVELEEIEDEGACYAFELDGPRVVFLCGQEFYPGPRFPSLQFSLVFVLDETDRRVDMLIDKHGPGTTPVRTIAAAIKRALEIPDTLSVREGTLDDIERMLANPTRAAAR